MAINNEHIVKLGAKWEAGTISEAEQLELDNWYHEHQDEPLQVPESVAASEYEHQVKIWNAIQDQIQVKRVHLWPRIAVAASIIFALGAGVFFYTNHSKTDTVQTATYASDIAPGKQGATLTLANGKKIRLSDALNGELTKEAGLTISKSADGQVVYSKATANSNSENKINTLSTAKGETYILTLSDKTQVWLNAASSLTYATSLNERGERRVKLSGEAYFQVAKDKMHPFIVETDKQTVEVLGTHFNISAYSDDKTIKTTLLEGSVKVAANGRSKMLVPNQQSTLNEGLLIINNVEADDVIAWKNGQFVFEDEPLESVMKKIARWYNVEIEYSGIDKTKRIGGGVSRYENVSAVLKQLELTKSVHFKIEGRKIIAGK